MHQVVGVDNPMDEEERLCNLIADSIAPRLVPTVETLSHKDVNILMVEVFPSSMRPHYLKSDGRDQGCYVRLGSSNRRAGPELIAQLQRSAAGVVFDEQPMPELGVEDLDLSAAQRVFGDDRVLTEQALLSLRLLVREQGRLVPTKGAILLFGKNRDYYFPDAWVQCGRFVGNDKAEIFDHVDIHASLPECVPQIMDFLKKHAMRGADFSELQRKDVWSIPLLMLREAIINALVHADYSHRGRLYG
ncbi:putative DNA binding domain-containing protein [Paenalcaligenes niemegkensis]|uniref:AlbA family DNA-binding domain-containing protein n=1 Tax=Paenalcaligenes niemegkensis TaxID=2895469 RepID=UPI001EE97662|nr:RNA-binding domain-containing protein [Paenalcaligenes niemegkensis]MCQ9618222.1 putative DNA binding domain-containing protein [Paenalcaligenes niemegkensis]